MTKTKEKKKKTFSFKKKKGECRLKPFLKRILKLTEGSLRG